MPTLTISPETVRQIELLDESAGGCECDLHDAIHAVRRAIRAAVESASAEPAVGTGTIGPGYLRDFCTCGCPHDPTFRHFYDGRPCTHYERVDL